MSNTLFPVFLKLDQLHTLVVGGGNVGVEKVSALLTQSPNARVTVVAPEIREELLEMQRLHFGLQLVHRKYRRRDLRKVDLVICATDQPVLHQTIRLQARRRKLLVNVADTPGECDFYLGSIVKKGNLKIGISTNGFSPTLAKRLREWLTDELPEEVDQLLVRLRQIRSGIQGSFADKVAYLNRITVVPDGRADSETTKEVNREVA